MVRLLLLAMFMVAPMLHSLEMDVKSPCYASSFNDKRQLSRDSWKVVFPSDHVLHGITHSPNDTFIIQNDGVYLINWSFLLICNAPDRVISVAVVKNDSKDNIAPNRQVSRGLPQLTADGYTLPITLTGSLTIQLKANDQLQLVITYPKGDFVGVIDSAMISIVQVGL